MTFLEHVETKWSQLQPRDGRLKVRRTETSAMAIDVETAQHLACIEAWESPMSLDVTILQLKSNSGRVLAAGPCATLLEADARLSQLSVALKEGAGGHAA